MTIPFDESRKQWAQDPAFAREYEALAPEFALARKLLEARSSAGFSQQDLARLMGTSQSAVARMESGHRPSIKSLERYADAVGMRLEISLVPR